MEKTYDWKQDFKVGKYTLVGLKMTGIPLSFAENKYNSKSLGAIAYAMSKLAIFMINYLILSAALYFVLYKFGLGAKFSIYLPLAVLIIVEILRGNGIKMAEAD
jgi:hypothetical protein